MEPTGLDHDDGIDGLSTERSLVLRRKGQHIGGIPVFALVQMQKDKNQQMLNVGTPSLCPCLMKREHHIHWYAWSLLSPDVTETSVQCCA